MTALTNTAIKALQPGQQIKDDVVPGLSVRAHRNGKSWMLYYRTRAGDVRRPKLGDAAVLTITNAREIARNELQKVAAGEDPKAAAGVARRDPTVDELADRVEREHYRGPKRWHREAMQLYRRDIAPVIGKYKVRALDYDDAKRVQDRLQATPVTANRAIAVLSKMLNLAERWKLLAVGTNPCQHVERLPERKRRRFASPAEMAKIGPLLEHYAADPAQASNVAFLYLLMFSGARPSEIGNGTPAMVHRIERDGQVVGVLRLESAKTGPRDVFLPAQAMAVLDRLPPDRERLAGRRTLPRDLWVKIRDKVGCPDLWARDFRRTFATTGLSSGLSLDAIGELLGHASRQTTMVYAKLMDDPAHAAAAGIADKMAKMLEGK